MAISALQLPSNQINSTVDPSVWASLGNLGEVYKKGQLDRAQQMALAQLGQGPQADAQTLLRSGVPSLATLGLNLQEKGLEQSREDRRYAVTDKRADLQLAIQQAAAKRAQETYDKADEDEAKAAELIKRFGAPPPAAAPSFPAPMPGPSPQATMPSGTMPPAPGAPPPATAPQGPQPPLSPVEEQMMSMVRPTPAPGAPPAAAPPPQVPQAPAPEPAPPEAGGLPAWAAPDATQRIASNLASGQPAATAGVSRDELAELYRNPLTRPIATAFLQKQFDPGTWKYEKTDDGRIIAVNSNDPTKTKDVTPPPASGNVAATKETREASAREQWALSKGYDQETAKYYGANKKLPKEDLSATEERMVEDRTKQIHAGEDVISNIQRLKELSKTAWSGYGAGTLATAAGAVLPPSMVPQGATDTTELQNVALQNVARQAKETFGARLAVAEVKLLNEIETNPLQSDAARQRIYTRLEEMFKRHLNDATTEREQIKNKTFFKSGTPAPNAPTVADPLGIR